MKNSNQNTILAHLKKAWIIKLKLILMLSLSTHVLLAQFEDVTFNFNPQPQSDYYLQTSWVASGYNGSCDCNYPPKVDFRQGTLGNIGGTSFHIETSSSTNPNWTSSAQIPVGPNQSLIFNNIQYLNPSRDASAFGCDDTSCSNYEVDNNNPPAGITLSTLPLKAASNLYVTDTNVAGELVLNWTVNTDIPASDYALEILISINGGTNLFAFITYDKSLEASSVITNPSGTKIQPGDQLDISVETIFLPTGAGSIASLQYTVPLPDGYIDGTITNLGNQPVPGVNVTAELLNPNDLIYGPQINTVYTTTTDANGYYQFPNLYYGLDQPGASPAQYKITPSLNARVFIPADITHTLSYANVPSTSTVEDVDFQDQTSYIINGAVESNNSGNVCGIDSIVLTVFDDQNTPVQSTETDIDGTYNVSVDNFGQYFITATNYSGTWSETISVMTSVDPSIPTIDQDFDYTQTYTVSGFLGAGCNEYIGDATIEFTSLSGCLIGSTTLSPSGLYTIDIPEITVTVQAKSFVPIPGSSVSALAVETAIGGIDTLVVNDTLVKNFIYRKPIFMEVAGMPEPPCVPTNGPELPILTESEQEVLTFYAWEEYGICPLDTGVIIITDNIGSSGTQPAIIDTIYVSNGIANYVLIPGEPTFSPPFTKNLSYLVQVDGNNSTSGYIEAVVTGAKDSGGASFTTAPVDIPITILRDPPGDGSYSYWADNSSRTVTTEFYAQTSQAAKIWAKLKVKQKSLLVNTSYQVGAGVTIGSSQDRSESETTVISSSQQFSTSSLLVDGSNGDVYIGVARAFKFSKAYSLDFDLASCSFVQDTVLMIDPQPVTNHYAYSEQYLENYEIPNHQSIVNNFASISNPTTDQAETALRSRSAIKTWQSFIQLNEDSKQAVWDSGNYTVNSFDGNVGSGFSSSESNTTAGSFNVGVNIDVQLALEFGLDIVGIIEGNAGVEVNLKNKFGWVNSDSTTDSETYGYNLSDGESDNFTYAVGKDPMFGSYVFKLLGGATSCPHEEGTFLKHQFDVSVVGPAIQDENMLAGQNIAYYSISMSNTSETNDPVTVLLSLDQTSVIGALVTENSQQISAPIEFNLGAPPSTATALIGIQKLGNFTSFPNVKIDFHDECFKSGNSIQGDFQKSVLLSAFFPSTCSPIELPTGFPEDNFIVNNASNNNLAVTCNNYDLINASIDQVFLQITSSGSSAWTDVAVLTSSDLNANAVLGTTEVIDFNTFPVQDGAYDIRWKLICSGGQAYSDVVSGYIDREAPSPYGDTYPSGVTYSSGDEISIRFTEDIDCSSIQTSTVRLREFPSNNLVSATISCSDNEIIITPDTDISNNIGQSYKAIVNTSLKDLYGNNVEDQITWLFTVGDEDSDGDGIGDSVDSCPNGNDYIDSDQDGIPDACDCFPLSGAHVTAGFDCSGCLVDTNTVMYFDGINDKIELNPLSAIVDEFTVEFWAKPDSLIPTSLTESNTGVQEFVISGVKYPFAAFPMSGGTISSVGVALGTNGIIVVEHGANLAPNTIVHYEDMSGWVHIAISVNNGQVSLYKNGLLIKQNPLSGLYPVSPRYSLGGNQNLNNYHFYRGKLDKFKVWAKELTQSEIQTQMFTAPDNYSSLVVHYDFEEGIPGADNSAVNISGATIHNMPRTATLSNWVEGPALVCQSCPAVLNFDGTSEILDGHYKASERITIDDGAEFGTDVTLDAPLVELNAENEFEADHTLYIDTEGCQSCPQTESSDYCLNPSDTVPNLWIESFELDNFTNLNSGFSSYSDFSTLSVGSVVPGQSLTFSLTSAGPYAGFGYVNVWIDYDFDGYFSFDEAVLLIFSDSQFPVTFPIDSFTESGSTILRIQLTDFVEFDACDGGTYGEIEDYRIFLDNSSSSCD